MTVTTPQAIFFGRLTRNFVLLPQGRMLLDIPGGNVLFSSIGFRLWMQQAASPGIVARVGEDYPQSWLLNFTRWGIDTRGVRILPEAVDVRSFSVYPDLQTCYHDDPVVHFAQLGQPFPKALLGYRPQTTLLDSRTRFLPISLRQGDMPPDYLDAVAAHLCPLDFLTHSLIPAVLRQAEFSTITIDPSSGYMNPTFWSDVPSLLTGLTAFLPSEEEIRFLFQGRSTDLWEMAEALAVYGCEIIVIKRGENGQFLYDAASHSRWEIPPYPARLRNPTGAGDAFCGGFLAGFRETYDPLQSVLHGNIAASFVVEGDSANYALEALPGLAQARLQAIQNQVRKI